MKYGFSVEDQGERKDHQIERGNGVHARGRLNVVGKHDSQWAEADACDHFTSDVASQSRAVKQRKDEPSGEEP